MTGWPQVDYFMFNLEAIRWSVIVFNDCEFIRLNEVVVQGLEEFYLHVDVETVVLSGSGRGCEHPCSHHFLTAVFNHHLMLDECFAELFDGFLLSLVQLTDHERMAIDVDLQDVTPQIST
ncbi:hypothetical protein D3C71_1729210 [compost metagenome]